MILYFLFELFDCFWYYRRDNTLKENNLARHNEFGELWKEKIIINWNCAKLKTNHTHDLYTVDQSCEHAIWRFNV